MVCLSYKTAVHDTFEIVIKYQLPVVHSKVAYNVVVRNVRLHIGVQASRIHDFLARLAYIFHKIGYAIRLVLTHYALEVISAETGFEICILIDNLPFMTFVL